MYSEYTRLFSFKSENSDNNENIIDIENSIRNSLLDNNNNIQQINTDHRICYVYILIIVIIIYLILAYIYI
jgi:hypothetical protein